MTIQTWINQVRKEETKMRNLRNTVIVMLLLAEKGTVTYKIKFID